MNPASTAKAATGNERIYPWVVLTQQLASADTTLQNAQYPAPGRSTVVSGGIRMPVTHAGLLSASICSAITALAPTAGTKV